MEMPRFTSRVTKYIIPRKIYFLFGLLVVVLLSLYLRSTSMFAPKPASDIHDGELNRMREKVNYREILMDPMEVDIVLKAIRGRKSYLEWGSGGSTLNFPQFISGKVVSIEHDRRWCQMMPARLAKKKIFNVDLHCISTIGTNSDEGTYATFKPYIDTINTLGESIWDFVLIDGRARVVAAIRALSYIGRESAVIVHDFERSTVDGSYDYSGILTYYDVVDRIGFSVKMNTVLRGIVHLQRKPKYDYLEGNHDQVQKILELDHRHHSETYKRLLKRQFDSLPLSGSF